MIKRLVCLLLLACGALMAERTDIGSIFENLPLQTNGWERNREYRIYHSSDLYDYIDGGAELYLSFGFRELLACRFLRSGHPEITVDIFDMGKSENAFGVFSHSREVLDDSIGQGSQYSAGLLSFWKGRFYVSLLAYPETAEARETVMNLGRRISDLISETGPAPVLLKRLPVRGLKKTTIRYFTHYIWQNSLYYISGENILNIGASSEAAVAGYDHNGDRYFILLVRYPDEMTCSKARQGFLAGFLPGNRDGIGQAKDGSWAGCFSDGLFLWIVLQSDSRGKVYRIVDGLKKHLKG